MMVEPGASTDEPVMEVLLASIGLATTGAVAAICGKAEVCSVLREVGGNTPINARHAEGASWLYALKSTPPTSETVPVMPLWALLIVMPLIRSGVAAVIPPPKAVRGT
ncbi:hypothetical protein [Pontibacter chinhatensis]|uniref:hypothetical protein n=1 Tax=Pontibacter chinhatensis TaxID=1436961 RepID=UPI0015879624|nr:hypothetical protein [Pontibacter chinhatensis]